MTEDKKTVVNANREGYVKSRTASGSNSLNNGDPVATACSGLSTEQVHDFAEQFVGEGLREKYGHLNLGMQRMNLGNKIRGTISKINKENAKILAKLEDGTEAPEQTSGEDQFSALIAPFVAEAEEIHVKQEEEKAVEKAQRKADKEETA